MKIPMTPWRIELATFLLNQLRHHVPETLGTNSKQNNWF
jgi:hypothetical protein